MYIYVRVLTDPSEPRQVLQQMFKKYFISTRLLLPRRPPVPSLEGGRRCPMAGTERGHSTPLAISDSDTEVTPPTKKSRIFDFNK